MEVRATIAALGGEWFGDAFSEAAAAGTTPDARYGRVRWEPPGARLKPGVAAVSTEGLDAPDVRFFLAANPGHEEGDEVRCLGRFDSAISGMNYLRRLGLRSVRKGARAGLGDR